MTIISSSVFVCSNSDYKKCPESNLPEFAFIGRSNVGKSSLINMLVSNKKLAKTSGTPGKTQLINHFLINNAWHLVDLPGYGYAKISMTQRKKWEKMINDYLLNRPQLINTFVLVDSRLEPQAIDMEFINRLGTMELPFSIIFTKTDKLTKNELSKNMARYREKLLGYWEELPPIFISSSESQLGKEEILNYISELAAGGEW